jgi:hypothetical protein
MLYGGWFFTSLNISSGKSLWHLKVSLTHFRLIFTLEELQKRQLLYIKIYKLNKRMLLLLKLLNNNLSSKIVWYSPKLFLYLNII